MSPLSSLWILRLLTPTDSLVSFIQAHDFNTSWMLIIPIHLCIALIYLSRSVPLLQLQPHIFYWTKYISFVGTPSSRTLGWKHFHTLNTSLSLDCPHVINIHSAFITALTSISSSFFSPPLSYFRPLLSPHLEHWWRLQIVSISLPPHSVLYTLPESSNTIERLQWPPIMKWSPNSLFRHFILSINCYVLRCHAVYQSYKNRPSRFGFCFCLNSMTQGSLPIKEQFGLWLMIR